MFSVIKMHMIVNHNKQLSNNEIHMTYRLVNNNITIYEQPRKYQEIISN